MVSPWFTTPVLADLPIASTAHAVNVEVTVNVGVAVKVDVGVMV